MSGGNDLGASADLSTNAGPDQSIVDDLGAGSDLAPPLVPGTYPFTFTATSGSVTASIPLTLTIN